MKTSMCATALAASVANALTIPQAITQRIEARDLSLPSSDLTTNCVNVGFVPSVGGGGGVISPRYTMSQINTALGAKSAFYGAYAQITSSSFDGSQLTGVLSDVQSAGAIFIASVQPWIAFSEVTDSVAQAVAASLKKFTDEGIEVWLRFGHEMNWYVQEGTYHGTSAEFITAWKTIYAANCKGNDKVKCYWSPNCDTASAIQSWWPGQDVVDVVGVDCYPTSSDDVSGNTLFQKFYGDFYNTFSKPYNLPFAIGETGAGVGQKEGWLKQLVNQDKSTYPNYVGMSWFEFDKEEDFRIVMTDSSTLEQTKQILLAGAGSGCSSGNSTQTAASSSVSAAATHAVTTGTTTKTTAKPSATAGTCNWGCWGWDCSASVPCQSPWTCQHGYCK